MHQEITNIVFQGKTIKFLITHPEDVVQRHIAETKSFYEQSILAVVTSLLKPGDLVLDIGANIGNHSIFFAGISSAHVEAFEPFPLAADIMAENLRLNNLEHLVRLHRLAAGATAGEATLYEANGYNMGKTSLVWNRNSDKNHRVRLIRLDDLEFGQPPKLLKIDVEGFEPEVIKGAGNLIMRHQPFILVEALNEKALKDILSPLNTMGYICINAFNGWCPTYLFSHIEKMAAPEAQRVASFFPLQYARLRQQIKILRKTAN